MDLERIPNVRRCPLEHVFEVLHFMHKPRTLWLEFGVTTGTTVNYIARFTEGTVYGFDSFYGLPERWREGYEAGFFTMNGNLPPVAKNVVLIKGLFQNTLRDFLQTHKDQRVGFLHIDSDLYSSAKYILTELRDRLERNCVIIFDELLNYPGWDGPNGELRAFREFLEENRVRYTWLGMNGQPTGMIGHEHESVAVMIHSVLPL